MHWWGVYSKQGVGEEDHFSANGTSPWQEDKRVTLLGKLRRLAEMKVREWLAGLQCSGVYVHTSRAYGYSCIQEFGLMGTVNCHDPP